MRLDSLRWFAALPIDAPAALPMDHQLVVVLQRSAVRSGRLGGPVTPSQIYEKVTLTRSRSALLRSEARLLCETSRKLQARAVETQARAQAICGELRLRSFRPVALHQLLDEPDDPILSQLEDVIGVPWCEAERVFDTIALAIRQAERGELAEGYRVLAESAYQVRTCLVEDVLWHSTLDTLWTIALDGYCEVFGLSDQV